MDKSELCSKRNNPAGPVRVLGGMMPTGNIETGGLLPVIIWGLNFAASTKFAEFIAMG
ncbi:hypothetical protein [Paracoccus lutimaris]|uniref:hypothetical protein n=1 Tax=Paracoccus lutimaris TaxID=1490030 RepID=UPI0015EFEF00|nr:hypothetical protein [Paracoccus lutimaris]